MTEKEFVDFQTEETDIKGIILKYLRYWYLFLLGVVICVAGAFLYLRYATPQYQITSTLLIKDDKDSPGLSPGGAFSDLDIFQSSKNINNEIQVLKSKTLMQRVLKELDLNASYYVEGDVKTTEVYGSSRPVKVIVHSLDTAHANKTLSLKIKNNNSYELQDVEDGPWQTYSFGKEVQTVFGRFTLLRLSPFRKSEKIKIRIHDPRSLANYYNQKLTVSPVNEEASVLTIGLVDPVPEKGKDIINKLIAVYNKEAVEDKNLIAANTIEFVDERLKFLTTELTDVEKDVAEYKQRFELTDVSSEAQLYLKRASEYNMQLAEYEIQLDVLNSIESYLKKQDNEFGLVPSTLSIQDPTLLGLITRFNELQLNRERMLRTSTASNPLVKNIEDQLKTLRLNLLENIQNIKNGLTITRKNILAKANQFESRIQQVPSIEQALLEISRQQGIKEGLYLYLLQKREEAALSLAATVSNSRVIDPAMAGKNPVEPKGRLIYLIALILGLGIPFAGIYIKDVLSDTVQQISDVERATNTPILGEIAHKKSDDLLVMDHESKSPVAELFRLIRANLQFVNGGKTNQVILVTSSMSGEGKTFFSINLGASLMLSGKKVVVLDFDFRRPGLTQNMKYQQGLGVTNYLISETVDIDNIIKHAPALPNLSVISSGPVPPNPGELMLFPKIGKLIAELKERFDYVILDTSPVGQVADALSLAPHADSSLFLIRYNHTHKGQVKIIDDIYLNKKLKHPMIVLNDAKKKNSYEYGYGYGETKKNGWGIK